MVETDAGASMMIELLESVDFAVAALEQKNWKVHSLAMPANDLQQRQNKHLSASESPVLSLVSFQLPSAVAPYDLVAEIAGAAGVE